jgi:hypothetical protein
MDTEVTIHATKTTKAHRRASRPYRLIEAVGLVALLYGLASSKWLTALTGAALIALTYTLYRRRHGQAPSDPVSMGMGDGGD